MPPSERSSSPTSMRTAPLDNSVSALTPPGGLDVVVPRFDSGEGLVIHAMKARQQYLRLLE